MNHTDTRSRQARRRMQVRFAVRRYYQKRAAEFVARGLTRRGTPRINVRHPELYHAPQPYAWKAKMRKRKYRAALIARGLTSEGKKPVLRPLFRAWKLFREGMNIHPPEVMTSAERAEAA